MKEKRLIPIGDIMSNIKITPTGREYPASSKADWDTWKFCLSLNPDELEAHIGTLRERIKTYINENKNSKEIKVIRRQIRIAEDTHKIKRRCPNIDDFDKLILDEIKQTSANILSIMEYQNTSIYYQEVDSIVNSLCEESILLSKCKYDEYVYSCVIISEILDYYKAKYEEDELLSYFDVSPIEYLDLKIILNKWLIGNYWAS